MIATPAIRKSFPILDLRRPSWTGIAPVCLVLVWILLLGGCSSTSHSVTSKVVAPKTIQPPKYVPTELIPYVPQFLGVLESQGFVVAPTEDPNALQLRLDFDPNPYNTQVSVSLWQSGSVVLTSQATNAGWGTVIVHGGAVATWWGQQPKVSKSK